MDFLGSIIGAGAKLLGGIFGNNEQEKINQENIANQNAINQQNIAEQEKFAQTGIQWKVADANKAGINPLAALGASTNSFSNVVGSTSVASNALGEAMGDAGQQLGRAVAAASPQAQRQAELENKLLEAKIANVNSDTVKNTADASQMATRLGAPGLPPALRNVPLPPEDPRGPVLPLMQRFRDRDGSIVWLPSEKAASPLQTMGAANINASMAARSTAEMLADPFRDAWSRFNMSGSRGDAWRAANPALEFGVAP